MSDRAADSPSLASRHLLGIEGLRRSEVEAILSLAREYKQSLKEGTPPTPLAGKLVANLFFEDSTRTRSSFEIAAKTLGAKVLNWSPTGSSLSKGETLLDTVRNIDAIGPAALVIRHRITSAAGPIASMFRTVSSKVSPFESEDPVGLQLSTLAPRVFAAISNEERVRVESSKNKLATSLPARGVGGVPSLSDCLYSRARERIASTSERRRPSMPSRCRLASEGESAARSLIGWARRGGRCANLYRRTDCS